jgi:hypothetical protein
MEGMMLTNTQLAVEFAKHSTEDIARCLINRFANMEGVEQVPYEAMAHLITVLETEMMNRMDGYLNYNGE